MKSKYIACNIAGGTIGRYRTIAAAQAALDTVYGGGAIYADGVLLTTESALEAELREDEDLDSDSDSDSEVVS